MSVINTVNMELTCTTHEDGQVPYLPPEDAPYSEDENCVDQNITGPWEVDEPANIINTSEVFHSYDSTFRKRTGRDNETIANFGKVSTFVRKALVHLCHMRGDLGDVLGDLVQSLTSNVYRYELFEDYEVNVPLENTKFWTSFKELKRFRKDWELKSLDRTLSLLLLHKLCENLEEQERNPRKNIEPEDNLIYPENDVKPDVDSLPLTFDPQCTTYDQDGLLTDIKEEPEEEIVRTTFPTKRSKYTYVKPVTRAASGASRKKKKKRKAESTQPQKTIHVVRVCKDQSAPGRPKKYWSKNVPSKSFRNDHIVDDRTKDVPAAAVAKQSSAYSKRTKVKSKSPQNKRLTTASTTTTGTSQVVTASTSKRWPCLSNLLATPKVVMMPEKSAQPGKSGFSVVTQACAPESFNLLKVGATQGATGNITGGLLPGSALGLGASTGASLSLVPSGTTSLVPPSTVTPAALTTTIDPARKGSTESICYVDMKSKLIYVVKKNPTAPGAGGSDINLPDPQAHPSPQKPVKKPVVVSNSNVTCPTCKKRFTHYDLYKDHLLTCGGVPGTGGLGINLNPVKKQVVVDNYKCRSCRKGFIHYNSYKDHLLTCGSLPGEASNPGLPTRGHFPCRICGKLYTVRHNLEKHMERGWHIKSLTCSVCGFKAACDRTMIRHMQNKHSEDKETFMCEICGKVLLYASSLEKHKLIHEDVLPYKCEFCDRRFRDKVRKTNHERSHTGERLYCDQCGKAYQSSTALRLHVRLAHLGEKPSYLAKKRKRKEQSNDSGSD